MADNKQYITQFQENGSVMISEDVIITIAAHAAAEVEGVASMNVKPNKKGSKGIKLTVGQEDEVYIECFINVTYGQSVVAVAKAVQDAVTNAVESMAGLRIASVNVNVCGIVRQ
ncbi:MAG: Asp23/Gls24 family envelope stress response protein [Oscillospiraceae bacterium]|nr:Asp23/Gls24 family envelope stress response protein [Oscillospiraceae bacterium]